MRKGKSLLFHCHRKQAQKIRDLNGRIAFERVTDRYTDQRTHGGMRGREVKEEEKQTRDIQ